LAAALVSTGPTPVEAADDIGYLVNIMVLTSSVVVAVYGQPS
jgi:hypothetical protein